MRREVGDLKMGRNELDEERKMIIAAGNRYYYYDLLNIYRS
jgi:hypothetical protein